MCRKLRRFLFEFETQIKNKQASNDFNPGPQNLNHNKSPDVNYFNIWIVKA